MKKKITLYIAYNHCLHFGKYKGLACWEIIDKDVEYLKWCIDNLKHLRFDGKVKMEVNDKIHKLNHSKACGSM